MKAGKVPFNVLREYVFPRLGARDPSVLVGPSLGEDAGVVELPGGLILAAHSDPITAASRYAGWLAVHVSSNDVAVSGVRPKWLLLTILLPQRSAIEALDNVMNQVGEAAESIGAAVIGGHTEVLPLLSSPLLVASAIGIAPREQLVRTSNARPGDLVLLTKTAGLEGAAILASDCRDALEARGVPGSVIREAEGLIGRVSVVPEAMALAERRLATSMHDPTEGGVVGGAVEVALASEVRIVLYEERIPVHPAVATVSRALSVDPLRLISSGALLATVPRGLVDAALEALASAGVEASIVGEVAGERGEAGVTIVSRDGGRREVNDYVPDEIYRVECGG